MVRNLEGDEITPSVSAGEFPHLDIDYLRNLESLHPGSIDAIYWLAERRLTLAHDREKRVIREKTISKCLGFLGFITVVGAATFLAMNDKTVAAVTAFSVTGVAVLAAFLGRLSMAWSQPRDTANRAGDDE